MCIRNVNVLGLRGLNCSLPLQVSEKFQSKTCKPSFLLPDEAPGCHCHRDPLVSGCEYVLGNQQLLDTCSFNTITVMVLVIIKS